MQTCARCRAPHLLSGRFRPEDCGRCRVSLGSYFGFPLAGGKSMLTSRRPSAGEGGVGGGVEAQGKAQGKAPAAGLAEGDATNTERQRRRKNIPSLLHPLSSSLSPLSLSLFLHLSLCLPFSQTRPADAASAQARAYFFLSLALRRPQETRPLQRPPPPAPRAPPRPSSPRGAAAAAAAPRPPPPPPPPLPRGGRARQWAALSCRRWKVVSGAWRALLPSKQDRGSTAPPSSPPFVFSAAAALAALGWRPC